MGPKFEAIHGELHICFYWNTHGTQLVIFYKNNITQVMAWDRLLFDDEIRQTYHAHLPQYLSKSEIRDIKLKEIL